MKKLLLTVLPLSFLLLTSASSKAPACTQERGGEPMEVIKSSMLKAFGGKKHLAKMEYVTYTLSRKAYQGADTVLSRQLWYVHLQEPLIVRLNITGTDTTTSTTLLPAPGPAGAGAEARAVHEGLLRSRFFNFLYLLTSPDVVFEYVKPAIYHGNHADIIRASSRQHPQWAIDLFVNRKGQIVTSSSPDPASGAYLRYADELDYVKIAGSVIFPLQYRIVQQEKVLAEGLFSDMQINKLSPFWQKQLKKLGVQQ